MPPKIAICGAGPAGLTLANLLRQSKADIDLTVFELDTSATSRTVQGGTLDLHPETGLAALKQMDLLDKALPFLRYEGEELVIADKNATEFVHITEAPKMAGYDARPEIDREKLKEILLEGCGEESVRWGKHLKRVDETKRTLDFNDGCVEGPFDLIVGADGAFSKVRHVLTEVRPRYSGICGFEAWIENPAKEHPEVSKFVGRGSYFTFSDGKAVMAQRMGDDSIKMSLWKKAGQDWPKQLMGEDGMLDASLKEKLLDEIKDWAPELREILKVAKLNRPWVLWELPVGHTWEHKEGFTLLGDAAHLCTPFAGLGVNAAMKDALELSDLITESLSSENLSFDEAVQKYEKNMFPRAKRVQAETMRNKTSGFSPEAPMGFVSGMIAFVAEYAGWPLDKGFLRFIPVERTVFGLFWLWSCFGVLRRKIREWRRR